VKESPWVGLNYIWSVPDFTQIANPAVWLAAAGQIFFTLSIGMGSIHCYASYLRRKDDVALTGATTAWTNELCEVVIGSALLLPIAVSYLGLQGVQDSVAGGSGFGLAFFTLPTLFNNWGPQFAPLAGFLWFGLLFLAAITSSLAMGQPVMAFLEDEFKLSRVRASWALMGMLLFLAVPVAMIHEQGVFSDFDFWVGTFALVVFALMEVILFAWAFGIDRGWEELTRGAELKVPRAFYYIMKYVTPTFIIVILLAAIFKPSVGWDGFFGSIGSGQGVPAWEWAGDSVIGKVLHKDLVTPEDASPEVVTYYENLRTVRTYDRIGLLAIFAFFSILVAIAWRRKGKGGTPS
jgi:SNF family Na+-dependent transporter